MNRLPDVSTAMPQGPLSLALVAGPPSPLKPPLPQNKSCLPLMSRVKQEFSPATVLMMPGPAWLKATPPGTANTAASKAADAPIRTCCSCLNASSELGGNYLSGSFSRSAKPLPGPTFQLCPVDLHPIGQAVRFHQVKPAPRRAQRRRIARRHVEQRVIERRFGKLQQLNLADRILSLLCPFNGLLDRETGRRCPQSLEMHAIMPGLGRR